MTWQSVMVPPRPWRLSPSPGVAEHIAAAVLPGIPQSQPSGAAFPKPCPSPALTLVPAASEVGEQVVVFAFLSWAPAFQPCTVLVTCLPLQHYSTQFLSLPSRLWVVTGSLCHRTVGWLRVPSGLVAHGWVHTPVTDGDREGCLMRACRVSLWAVWKSPLLS